MQCESQGLSSVSPTANLPLVLSMLEIMTTGGLLGDMVTRDYG